MARGTASLSSDTTGVHLVWSAPVAPISSAAKAQGKLFVRNSPDGLNWLSPALKIDSVRGHEWQPDMASAGGVIRVLFYDSRNDPGYAPDLPPGNKLDLMGNASSSGPSVDAYVAESSDGGLTWTERRLSSKSFAPNFQVHNDARQAFLGDYITISAVSGGAFAVWTDNRDVVGGTDIRAGATNVGWGVYAPCAWDPNDINAPRNGDGSAYATPSFTDACLSQGGLDQNTYGRLIN